MSAATRRPYLGEDVHYTVDGQDIGTVCKAAKITDVNVSEWQELFVFLPPHGLVITAPYRADHQNETWHYAH